MLIGSFRLILDDAVVLLSDFEDGADQAFVDHSVHLIVDLVHDLVQRLILCCADLLPQFLVHIDHRFFHYFFLLDLVPIRILLKEFENLVDVVQALLFKDFHVNL